jgi:hypothetical protein
LATSSAAKRLSVLGVQVLVTCSRAATHASMPRHPEPLPKHVNMLAPPVATVQAAVRHGAGERTSSSSSSLSEVDSRSVICTSGFNWALCSNGGITTCESRFLSSTDQQD